MNTKNLSERFLQIYNELDNYIHKSLKADSHVDHASLLRQMTDANRIFSAYYKDLKTFAEIRNLLVHNPYAEHANPMFIPHVYVVKRYEDIVNQILRPQKAMSIAVPRRLIYTALLGDNALNVMKAMNDNVYTHIPVMEGDKMIGVFSENTILSYLVHNKDSIVTEDVKLNEFKDFIPLDKHPSEYFEFIGREALLADVEEIFRRGLVNRKRVAVIFITENGNKEERLLGMLTAWDIAGKQIV